MAKTIVYLVLLAGSVCFATLFAGCALLIATADPIQNQPPEKEKEVDQNQPTQTVYVPATPQQATNMAKKYVEYWIYKKNILEGEVTVVVHPPTVSTAPSGIPNGWLATGSAYSILNGEMSRIMTWGAIVIPTGGGEWVCGLLRIDGKEIVKIQLSKSGHVLRW